MNAWYFGCVHGSGHFWHDEQLRHLGGGRGLKGPEGYPWGRVDGVHTPKGTRHEHVAALHHKDGWTVLSMHDYTVDKRGGSHSTFVFDEHLDFDQALAAATEWFPQVVERVGAICPEPG